MRAQRRERGRVVRCLTAHAAVERVYYPGLETHPGHAIARAQQQGFGAMVSFELRGGLDELRVFLDALRLFSLAESLAASRASSAHPASMTHAAMTPDARAGPASPRPWCACRSASRKRPT